MFFYRILHQPSVVLLALVFLLFPGTASATITAAFHTPPDLPRIERTAGTYPSLAAFEEELKAVEADGSEIQAKSPSTYGLVPPIRTYMNDFFPDLVGGTERIFSRDNLPVALIGTVLAGVARTVDHVDINIKDYFQTRRPMDGISKYGDTIGQGYYHVGVGAMLFGAGVLSNDKKLADTGIVTLEALLANCIATGALKYTVGRTRPNGGNKFSFPSGHASSSATLAASISAMYDWDLRIAVPLYALTFFVGGSRIQDNEHYLSDVIAGIALGTIIGSSFANYHKGKEEPKKASRGLSIAPVFEKDLKGAVFTFKW